MKNIASFFLVSFVLIFTSYAFANDYRYSSIFNYVEYSKQSRKSMVIKPAPIAGKCVFSFGAYNDDNFLLLEVNRTSNFVTINSAIFTLSLPLKKPYPKKWQDNGFEFIYLGKEWVVVGKKRVLSDKILSLGSDGDINQSTEIWLDHDHGILAYRPLINPGKFVLDTFPEKSLLDCQ